MEERDEQNNVKKHTKGIEEGKREELRGCTFGVALWIDRYTRALKCEPCVVMGAMRM